MLPFILLGFVVAIAVILIGRSYTSRHITKYSREEADERVASGKALYLDVRTDKERQATVIKKSLHIPLAELSDRIEELERHRKKEIIAYCRTGTRSLAAADVLDKAGYQSANLTRGIGIGKGGGGS